MCGDGVRCSGSVLPVLFSLLGLDVKRRIREQLGGEVAVAEVWETVRWKASGVQDVRQRQAGGCSFLSIRSPSSCGLQHEPYSSASGIGGAGGGTVFGGFCDFIQSFATNGTKHF